MGLRASGRAVDPQVNWAGKRSRTATAPGYSRRVGRASRGKQGRRARPPSELEDRLLSQLRFLRASAVAFDGGASDEASRLALVIRILCHNGNGPSLLQQLGLLKKMWFYDTASAVHDPTPGGQLFASAFPSTLVALRAGPNGMDVHAPLDMRSPSSLAWSRFRPWWNKPVLSADLSKALVGGPVQLSTRGDLVLWLGNQDGGAHVDPMVDAEYDLVRNAVFGSLKASDGDLTTVKMPLAASMRQIAHEVLVSTHDYSGEEPPQPLGAPHTRRPAKPG